MFDKIFSLLDLAVSQISLAAVFITKVAEVSVKIVLAVVLFIRFTAEKSTCRLM